MWSRNFYSIKRNFGHGRYHGSSMEVMFIRVDLVLQDKTREFLVSKVLNIRVVFVKYFQKFRNIFIEDTPNFETCKLPQLFSILISKDIYTKYLHSIEKYYQLNFLIFYFCKKCVMHTFKITVFIIFHWWVRLRPH